MSKSATVLIFTAAMTWHTASASAELVIEAETAAIRTEGGPYAGGGWNLWSSGRVGQPLRFQNAGSYGVVVRAWGSVAGGVWPEMALLVDGKAVKTVTVGRREPEDYRFNMELSAGVHEIAVAFLNDALVGQEDRNLYLKQLTVTPPPGVADPALVDKRELAKAAEEREWEVVAATRAAIEKHRKVDATIRILDAAGQPVPGVKVSIEQTSHEFLFGCNIYMFDRYREQDQNHVRQGAAHHGIHAGFVRAENHGLAPRRRVGRGGPSGLRRQVLPGLLRPSRDAGDYLVGPVRPGLLVARRRDATGRHVAQTRLRAAPATDPRRMEDPCDRRHG
jgi:hypothetical protein